MRNITAIWRECDQNIQKTRRERERKKRSLRSAGGLLPFFEPKLKLRKRKETKKKKKKKKK